MQPPNDGVPAQPLRATSAIVMLGPSIAGAAAAIRRSSAVVFSRPNLLA